VFRQHDLAITLPSVCFLRGKKYFKILIPFVTKVSSNTFSAVAGSTYLVHLGRHCFNDACVNLMFEKLTLILIFLLTLNVR